MDVQRASSGRSVSQVPLLACLLLLTGTLPFVHCQNTSNHTLYDSDTDDLSSETNATDVANATVSGNATGVANATDSGNATYTGNTTEAGTDGNSTHLGNSTKGGNTTELEEDYNDDGSDTDEGNNTNASHVHVSAPPPSPPPNRSPPPPDDSDSNDDDDSGAIGMRTFVIIFLVAVLAVTFCVGVYLMIKEKNMFGSRGENERSALLAKGSHPYAGQKNATKVQLEDL